MNNTRPFEEVVKDIKKNRELANTKLVNPDARTYTTKLGHIRRAKENLKSLFLEYRGGVSSNAIFILVSGKQSQSFIDIATSEDYGCFNINAESLYEEIVSKVDKRHYSDQSSSPAIFDLLMSSFNDICDDIGILGYNAVYFESKFKRRLQNKADLIQLTKEAFNEKVGSELVGLYAVDKVSREAVNKEYDGITIPIIINTEDKDLLKELETSLLNINKNVFSFNITKKQNVKLVEEKLLKIKSSSK